MPRTHFQSSTALIPAGAVQRDHHDRPIPQAAVAGGVPVHPYHDGDAMTRPANADDPVRRRRASAGRIARIASRSGYALIAIAVVLFFVALATEFNAAMSTVIVIAFIGGCVLLAPAIILGYAVKAAEREDRERGL